MILAGVAAACGPRSSSFDGAGAAAPEGDPCEGSSLAAGDHARELDLGDRTRAYTLHVPLHYDPTVPAPLVFAFHGAAGNGLQFDATAHWRAESDRSGFLLVLPNGTGYLPNILTWNAGACCGFAQEKGVDDVGFMRAMIEATSREACVDPKRIFATGHSNGGAFSHRLGCEMADQLAAIAPNSGLLLNRNLDASPPVEVFACEPSRPISVFELHGTLDELALYNGGKSTCAPATPVMPSVDETVEGWRVRNGCSATSSITYASPTVTCRSFDECAAGVETTLCTLTDEGHAWPGGKPSRAPCVGPWTNSFDATSEIWKFFSTRAR